MSQSNFYDEGYGTPRRIVFGVVLCLVAIAFVAAPFFVAVGKFGDILALLAYLFVAPICLIYGLVLILQREHAGIY